MFGSEKPGSVPLRIQPPAGGSTTSTCSSTTSSGCRTVSATSSSNRTPASCSGSEPSRPQWGSRKRGRHVASISLGIGTSHAPQLGTPPDQWGQRAKADRANAALVFSGKDYPFEDLRTLRHSAFAADCEPEVWRARHAASRTAIEVLGRTIHAADLDALVIVSSDHKETFSDELLPQFAVYWATASTTCRSRRTHLMLPAGAGDRRGRQLPEGSDHPCLPRRACRSPDQGDQPGRVRPGRFPRAARGGLRRPGIPHGWGFVIQQVLGGEHVPPDRPRVRQHVL